MRVVVAAERDKRKRWQGFARELKTAGYRVDFIHSERDGSGVLEQALSSYADVLVFVPRRPPKMSVHPPSLSVFGVWIENRMFVGGWLPENAVVVSPSYDVLDAASEAGFGRKLLWGSPVSDVAREVERKDPKKEVVVVGSWNPLRESAVRRLRESGVKAYGVGNGWSRSRLPRSLSRPTTTYKTLLQSAANAAVTLYLLPTGLDSLLVDLLYMGCCVVCEWRKELEILGDAVCVGEDVVGRAAELVSFDLGRRKYERESVKVHKLFSAERMVQALLDA